MTLTLTKLKVVLKTRSSHLFAPVGNNKSAFI